MSELAKAYDPREIEGEIAALWEQGNYFHAEPDDRPVERRFCIVIPPPNVTGALHLGHALNNTLQDVLIRWHRMRGDNTLWMPGTDHAGIATQAVVEKRVREEEGKSRHDLGRDELVKRIWDWKDQYEARIASQFKLMGCSCDFARMRFTLDDGCSLAVRRTFFSLFKSGYIFRGKRLVNWDCELQTAVADDEVYHETVKGKFYHFKYPLTDGSGHLTIATTRPETMLGDTAVAVNPRDERYTGLIGKTVMLPLMDREIPVIADEWADPEKGSGCVKITPAHDPNDYEVGLRHRLPMVNVLNVDGTINANGGAYAGQDRFAARKAVVAALEELDLVDKIEDREQEVGHSDRSKSLIEPFLSDQWFVRMTELADPTLEAVRNGDVVFHPERYKSSYLDWLSEKRDWCISRQLWWGHRIPVWTRDADDPQAAGQLADETTKLIHGHDGACLQVFGEEDDERRTVAVCLRDDGDDLAAALEAQGFVRDDDVLDTWFSSMLWPHSTLGWPSSTPELNYYYPTSVLITSRDIITLWVVRMVLSGLHNLERKPFDDVYIHPKILDGRGVTMSKSKGNGVDPVDIIEAFGADALRYGLAAMTTETQDIRMPVNYMCPHCDKLTPQTDKNMFVKGTQTPSKQLACKHCKKEFATRWADEAVQKELGLSLMVSDKFEAARNFVNKLWNALRFAFMNLEGAECQPLTVPDLPPEDRWILAELSTVCRQFQADLADYQYSRATLGLRSFFWDGLCDWYLELVKFRLREDRHAEAARQVLAFCCDQVLRLLHPIVPFVTERLWSQLNDLAAERGLPGLVELERHDVLAVSPYPPAEGYPALEDDTIRETFADLQDAVRGIREIRGVAQLPPKQQVTVTIRTSADRAERLEREAHILEHMGGIEALTLAADAQRPPGSAIKIVGHLQIFVHGVVDDAAERTRIEKSLIGLDKRMKAPQSKLGNAGYLQSAPPEVVAETRQLLAELEQERDTLQEVLKLLG